MGIFVALSVIGIHSQRERSSKLNISIPYYDEHSKDAIKCTTPTFLFSNAPIRLRDNESDAIIGLPSTAADGQKLARPIILELNGLP